MTTAEATLSVQAKNPEHQKYYDYLVELRDSGRTNMWGAAAFLERKFKLNHKNAGAILVEWIEAMEEKYAR